MANAVSPNREPLSFSLVRFLPAFAACLLVYGITLWVMPRDGFWIVDNGCKLIQTEGIIRNGYRDFSIPWPGERFDPSLALNPLPAPFGSVHEGKIFGVYSYTFALLSTFPFRLLGTTGLYILPLLGGLLTLPAVWLLAGDLSMKRLTQPAAVLLVALCTPLWFYSVTFWEHTLAISLTTWAVALWWRSVRRHSLCSLFLSGLCSGLSIYFRDELYLFCGLLAMMVFLYERTSGRSRIVVYCLACIAVLIPLWFCQWRILGNPIGFHFLANAQSSGGLIQHVAERWTVFRSLLLNSHQSLFVSIVIAAPFLALWVLFPRVSRGMSRWLVPVLAGVGIIACAVILTGFRNARSPILWMLSANALFAASPLLILGFIRTREERVLAVERDATDRDSTAPDLQRALWLIATGFLLLWMLVAPFANAVGIHWGSRFLLPIYPLLGVLAAGSLARWWSASQTLPPLFRALPLLLVGLTSAEQVYSLQLLHHRKDYSIKFNEAVAEHPQRVVVVASKRLLPELARRFYDRILVLAESDEDMERMPGFVELAGENRALLVLSEDSAGPGRESQVIVKDRLNFATVYLRSLKIRERQER